MKSINTAEYNGQTEAKRFDSEAKLFIQHSMELRSFIIGKILRETGKMARNSDRKLSEVMADCTVLVVDSMKQELEALKNEI